LTPTIPALLVVLVAAALAAASYFTGGRPERALWPAVAGRAVAWSALALLLVNVSCPGALESVRPLVLLDASPSMDAPGGQGTEARAAAARLGEVREFTRSRVVEPLTAAVASGREIIVITDGEIVDAGGIPAGLLAAAEWRVLPRSTEPDIAITVVQGARHLAQGDSLVLDLDLRGSAEAFPEGLAVEARVGAMVLGRVAVPATPGARAQVRLTTGPVALPPGQHLVELRLDGSADAEPRTDIRLHHLTVSATPGIVVVANPASWESRFLFRTLSEVAGLPVEGFLQLEPGSWRRMSDLRPATGQQVRDAVQGADLLVTFGAEPAGAAQSGARGRWQWPAGAATEGDWYLDPEPAAPLAAALAGIPADSLLPADGLLAVDPAPGSWIGFSARLGRRGAPRPALVGSEGPGGRRLIVAATGLWRWAFRGGIQEQAYRSWVASSVTWLLGRQPGPGTAGIQPVRAVVERDEPIVFQRTAPDTTAALPITLVSGDGTRADTLRFDGSGWATLPLPVGSWSYTLADGTTGVVAVEAYSSEFLPGPVTLESREGIRTPSRGSRGSRDLLWLFGLAVAGWCLEWMVRRRAGMR